MAVFTLQWQIWGAATEIIWLAKPLLFIIWPFIGKKCLLISDIEQNFHQTSNLIYSLGIVNLVIIGFPFLFC